MTDRLHTVYLALGSNIGERLINLRNARQAMTSGVSIEACSPVYETPPWGVSNQPAFLNQVVKASTCLAPQALLDYLKGLEIQLGRRETYRNGPRLIDIDILFYDDLVLDTPPLTIPHPRMEGRTFVWLPLVDLAPDFRHPLINKTARQILAELDTSGITRVGEDCLPSQPEA